MPLLLHDTDYTTPLNITVPRLVIITSSRLQIRTDDAPDFGLLSVATIKMLLAEAKNVR